MNLIYFSIVILSIYGDLLKRILPAQVALGGLYLTALGILFSLIWINWPSQKNKRVNENIKHGTWLTFLISGIISVYLLLFLLTPNQIPFLASLTSLLYQCIPLLYAVAVIQLCPKFDLARLSNIFHVLMIPINLIGLTQYIFDPTFLVIKTTTYIGIVERNLGSESYQRLPSIFADAGRYNALGLMQIYFSIILLCQPRKKNEYPFLWILFNLLSGFLALLVSGARSRILLLMLVAALIAVSFLLSLILKTQYLNVLWKKLFSNIFHSSSLIFGFLGIGLVLILQIFTDSQVLNQFSNWIADFPVLSLLQSGLSNESSGTGDNVLVRFFDAINISMPPSDVSLLGEGMGINWVLGSQEFGIRAIWVECGLVGGCFILLAFSGIIYLFLNVVVRAILSAQPLRVIIFSIPLLIIMSGLMTGLTVLYELSSGLLLWISVGAITQYLYQPITKYQPLPKEKYFSR
jgi:hypothetical protein